MIKRTSLPLLALLVLVTQFAYAIHELEHLGESHGSDQRCQICLQAGSLQQAACDSITAFPAPNLADLSTRQPPRFHQTLSLYHTSPRGPPFYSLT